MTRTLVVLFVAWALVTAAPNLNAQVRPTSLGRVLAPDALVVIPPAVELFGETVQGPIDLSLVSQHPELEWTPNEAPKSDTLFERAKGVTFRVPIHCLELAFKPVRTIETSVMTDQGAQTKLIWYLVYRVRYLGSDYDPAIEIDRQPFRDDVYGKPSPVSVTWVRFMPRFRLVSSGKAQQSKLDEVFPQALAAIEARERIGKPLFDSISIQSKKIDISNASSDSEVWGVATWTDVDPRTNFFSVEVTGLTNAQRIEQQGDDVRYLQKTLVLNFFRPGDTIDEADDVIRYGVPAVNRVGGLKEVLRKAVEEKQYELSIVGRRADASRNTADTLREIAQTISQMGGQRFESYARTGSLIFSFADPEPEQKIQDQIRRQLGLDVQVVNRAIPLSEAIRRAEQAGDEKAQVHVLEQYGLKDRLDHHWIYR